MPSGETETPQSPAQPERVVGKARSQEEVSAFQAMVAETERDVKISKAQEFLQTFPDSGLTPMVHSDLAEVYRQRADVANFLKHGEEALKELPDAATLLATMSFYYAEGKQPAKAAESATRALAVLGTLEKPQQLTASEWARQKFFLSGESHYALGRVKLGQAQNSMATGPEDPTLQEAVKHFQQSLEADPEHEFASYRLGEAYERQGDIENAVKMFARTTAIAGNIALYAQQRLEELYKEGPELKPREEVVVEQKEAIEKARQERQQLLDQIESETTPLEITQPPTPSATQPPQG